MKVSDIRKMMMDAGIDLDATKEAMEMVNAEAIYAERPVMTEFSWVKETARREAVLSDYRNARRQLDRFVMECVKPVMTKKRVLSAEERIGLNPKSKCLKKMEVFATAEFATMYDESVGEVAIDVAIKRTKQGIDADFDVAMEMLAGLRYTWLEILNTKANFGLKCRDLLTGDECFLIDQSLSCTTDLKGCAFATGILPVGECYMTTGFGLPVPTKDAATILDAMLASLDIPTVRPIFLSKKETARFAATSIGSLLGAGMGEQMDMNFL